MRPLYKMISSRFKKNSKLSVRDSAPSKKCVRKRMIGLLVNLL